MRTLKRLACLTFLLLTLAPTSRADPIVYHFVGQTATMWDLGGHTITSVAQPYDATITLGEPGGNLLTSSKTEEFLAAGSQFARQFYYPEDQILIGSLPDTYQFRYEYHWSFDPAEARLLEMFYVMDHSEGVYVAGEQWVQTGVATLVGADVPEPNALVFIGVGGIALGMALRRHGRRSQ